jgi:hypothetical protein
VPKVLWTKEKCRDEALKYQGRWEFQKNSRSAYNKAHSSGWLDEICSHMKPPKNSGGWTSSRKPAGYWTKSKCHEEALRYQTRYAFQEGSKSAYLRAFKQGWLDEVCSHMRPVDHGLLCGYVIYNERLMQAYVGLTARPLNVRLAQHRNEHSTRSRIIIDEADTKSEQLTKHVYRPEEALDLEKRLYAEFEGKGYELLNSKKSLGGVGGADLKWDVAALKEEARKYGSISEFARKNKAAYNAALRQEIVDEVTVHMKRRKLRNGHWQDKEACREAATKYRTRSEFQKKAKGAYFSAFREGWLDEICVHMDTGRHLDGYWNVKENCRAEALKYKSRSEFRKHCSGAVHAAIRHGWLEEICAHMPKVSNRPQGHWTKERCSEEARKYESVSKFHKESNGAYDIARKNGWLEEITSHMKKPYKPRATRR